MKSNAVFFRKENEFDTNPCTIEKIIELSEDRYAMFAQNMLRNHEFISESNGFMYRDDEGRHCLLVLGKGCDDGILVESEGSDYARYSAFIPHARDFVNAQICQMADKIVKDGTELTESGLWTMEFDDIKEHFDTTVTTTNGIGQLLFDELREREEVAACIMTEDCIEMTYHLEYCPECQQGGVAGAMSLMSLMGCNLEDVYLVCHSSDVECKMISELNRNILTEEGAAEWRDVLNAEVKSIKPTDRCMIVELTNCDAFRLSAFTAMLTGKCAFEDYERWIKSNEINGAQKEETPKLTRNTSQITDLAATYEELYRIPDEESVTHYVGDYGSHYFNYGITDQQIQSVYEKALAAIEMTDAEFMAKHDAFIYRGEIIGRMRDCLLAKNLNIGEEIMFVATEPYGGKGDFSLRGGILLGVNAENKTCSVKGCFFTMDDVPLHYILGRYDESITHKHYGLPYVEVLYGEYPALAQQYLKETEESWNAKWNTEQVQNDESAPVLSM